MEGLQTQIQATTKAADEIQKQVKQQQVILALKQRQWKTQGNSPTSFYKDSNVTPDLNEGGKTSALTENTDKKAPAEKPAEKPVKKKKKALNADGTEKAPRKKSAPKKE